MRTFCVLLFALSIVSNAFSAPLSSWHSALQGDPKSVGRGGTGIVLSDDLWGVFENPAGSAMIVGGTTLQLSSNSIEDRDLNPGETLKVRSAGVVAPETPWGFAIGGVNSNQTELINEYTVSTSRLFENDRLSLGAALNFGQSPTDTALGTTLGALYRFPKRFILGASYRTPMQYVRSDHTSYSHPGESGLGAGYIPNRFFKTELGFRFRGASVPADSSLTVQPHLGFEYQFVSLRQIQIRLYAGTYFETTRLHETFGIGADPWIFSFGTAVDTAPGYRNYLFAFGLDIGRTLKKLKIIPPSVPAPPGGLFPKPLEVNEDWMNERMQDDPENSFHEIGSSLQRIKRRIGNMDQVIKDQPGTLKEESDSISDDWNDIKEDLK